MRLEFNKVAGTFHVPPARKTWGELLQRTAHGMCLLLWWLAAFALAEPPKFDDVVRELYVPFDDLPLILSGQNERIFMPRSEFEALQAAARARPAAESALIESSLLTAEYDIAIDENQASIVGLIDVDVYVEGVVLHRLNLSDIQIRRATLDEASAPLALDEQGHLVLVLQGRGRHRLRLDLTAPIESTVSQQTLKGRLPNAASTRMRIVVSGNVEIKSGSDIISRQVDEAAKVTRLEILPIQDSMAVVMSLNNKRLGDNPIMVAKSVMIDELTENFERLSVSATLQVVNGSMATFRFLIPPGFDVVDVQSHQLSKWHVDQENDHRVLSLHLIEASMGRHVVNMALLKSEEVDTATWNWPHWEVLDAVGQSNVLQLRADRRFQMSDMVTDGLIAIDELDLGNRPRELLNRSVGTFYAASNQYQWKAALRVPDRVLRASQTMIVRVLKQNLEIQGGILLSSDDEKIFAVDLSVPADWQVSDVRLLNGTKLDYQRHSDGDRVRVHIVSSSPTERSIYQQILFTARQTPTGWLDPWEKQTIEFPKFLVQGASSSQWVIAVQTEDDLSVQPAIAEKMTPIFENEKANRALANIASALAYQSLADDWRLTLDVTRATPRLTASWYAFYKCQSEDLAVHMEVTFSVDRASARQVTFSLPVSTPTEIDIVGLDGIAIKETKSIVLDNRRHWSVQLAQEQREKIRLAIDFQRPHVIDDRLSITLPDGRAENVAYQSGVVAIEGNPEFEFTVRHPMRSADVGELVDANYKVGRHLIGVFNYVGISNVVELDAERRQGFALPSTIVQRADLTTIVSGYGISQTAARFRLKNKQDYVEAALPKSAELWSMAVDGKPILPQRIDDRLLIELPRNTIRVSESETELLIVYQMPIGKIGWRSQFDLQAPTLFIHGESLEANWRIPIADVQWQLWVSDRYQLSCGSGSVFPDVLSTSFWNLLAQRTDVAADSMSMTRSAGGTHLEYEFPREEPPLANHDEKFQQLPLTRTEPAPQAFGGGAAQAAQPDDLFAGESMKSAWSLAGVRSLPIEIEPEGRFQQFSFSSFGNEPTLSATLFDRQRSLFLTWLTGLLVVIGGLLLINASKLARWRYIFVMLALSLFLPNVTPWPVELQSLSAAALYGIVFLVGVYLILTIVQWIFRARPSQLSEPPIHLPSNAIATSFLFVMASLSLSILGHNVAFGQPPSSIDNLKEKPLISIPADTIVVPYRAGSELGEVRGKRSDDVLWVGLATYRKLQEQAQALAVLERPSPIAWTWRGIEYTGRIVDENSVELQGRLTIESFSNSVLAIPLPMENGVVKNAKLDDGPAHIQQDGDGLHWLIDGRGVRTLTLKIVFPIRKESGWRSIQGRIPSAPAVQLNWTMPDSGTELQFPNFAERGGYTTSRTDESLIVPLTKEGGISLQWRLRAIETAIDQGLSADSKIAFDIPVDGVRLTWNVSLAFRGGQRDLFRLSLPSDYLVEQVIGANVRGWRVEKVDSRQTIEVQLLKSVTERESFSIVASHRGLFGKQPSIKLDLPECRVEEALLQRGTIVVRSSPIVEVHAENILGLSRREPPREWIQVNEGHDEDPLRLLPFQAFDYSGLPYSMTLAVSDLEPVLDVATQTIVRVSEKESNLESRFLFRIKNRRLYHFQLKVPSEWEWSRPNLPCDFEWSAKPTEDGRRLINIRLMSGQASELSMILRGHAQGNINASDRSFALPEFEVLEADRQEGQLVVQTDPGYDLQIAQLEGCEAGSLSQVEGWLLPEQRALARSVISYRSFPYRARLQLVAREAKVDGLAISNVKVTDRTIEETVYIEWTIQDAGLHQFAFSLPHWMSEARIRAPLLRQVTKTPSPGNENGPIDFVLDLQDDVLGQYRILVELERPISTGLNYAPIPILKTGVTEQRYVTLENVGRDELLIQHRQGLAELDRRSQQWKSLATLLGGQAAQAYLIQDRDEEPILEFQTNERAEVKTAQGRIGLAKTVLMIDEGGAYRGAQEFRIENRTEPFLELEMPSGSSIWTVEVAGESVKPIQIQIDNGNSLSPTAPNQKKMEPDSLADSTRKATGFRVRLPLVRTEEGDLDYGVVVKYGGQFNVPRDWNKVNFPLIHTVNINVELSQVRLLLPQSRGWYNFSGSMRRVNDQSDFMAGLLCFKNNQIDQLTNLLSSKYDSSSFTRSRAAANLKAIESTVERETRSYFDSKSNSNAELQSQVLRNSASMQKAQQQLQANELDESTGLGIGNRGVLNGRFDEQSNWRANDVVSKQSSNFSAASPPGVWNEPNLSMSVDLSKSSLGNAAQSTTHPPSAKPVDRDESNIESQAKRYRQAIEQGQIAAGRMLEPTADTPMPAQPASLPNVFDGKGLQEQAAQVPMGGSADGQLMDTFFRQGQFSPSAPPFPLGFQRSLQFTLPERGQEFLFTTPRGKIELAARSVSVDLQSRLINIGLSVILLAVARFPFSRRRHGAIDIVI